jgi:hypothetical protein
VKRYSLPLFLCIIAATAGCSKTTYAELPAVIVDYGMGDKVEPDVAGIDTQAVDHGNQRDSGADVGGTDNIEVPDIVEDTGPCTLVCPAWMRCGPNPCGDGECGKCKSPEPVCNLLTSRCVAQTCEPDCDGRECGSDGCDGTCGNPGGKCETGKFCNYDTGICGTSCTKNCAGKLCGDDGCGGTCAPGCKGGVECKDGICVNEGMCSPSSTALQCAVDLNSASGDTSWSIGTTTSALFNYPEACGTAYNPAPEKAYRLVVGPGMSGNITISLSQTLPLFQNFLYLYMIEETGSGCVASSCVAWGDDGLTYNVPASASGHTYYLIVDSDQMNNGVFTLTIESCEWNGFPTDVSSDP